MRQLTQTLGCTNPPTLARHAMLEILLNNSRSFGGYEEETSRADLAVWEEIARTYSVVQGSSELHGAYEIRIDWGPRLRYERKYCALWNGAANDPQRRFDGFEFEHVHVCPASVEFMLVSTDKYRDGSHELHQLLVDLYLIANLATPGSFNLHRSFIRNTQLDPAKDFLAQTELDLSEYVFETAWHEGRTHPWLKVGFISFVDVESWFRSLNLVGKSVATTDTERAIFSLLQLGRVSFMDQTAVMWIASALEALFDTPSGSSFSFLCKRAGALLMLTESEGTQLRRLLREFFDLRNAFVHGGGRIHHILADDRDKSVEDDISNLLGATNFASAVLVAAIQELVRRNWKGIAFHEQLGPM